jgi:ornithine cyclodeaminase
VAALGVFGTGVQAKAHVRALCRVRTFARVLVAATSPKKGAAFAQWVEAAVGVQAEPSTHDAASGADVLAVCTTSPGPVVAADRVRAGSHVNAVGAFTPATRELPTDLVCSSRVYVDTRAGAFAEAGDLLLPVQEARFALDRVVGELGEVIVGRVQGRSAPGDVTLYKSVGAAFLDAAMARLAHERAVERGVGQQFRFAGGAGG